MARWNVFLALVFFFALSAAQAREVKIGSSLISLVAPPEFCELDEDSRPVKAFRELLGGRNQLLASLEFFPGSRQFCNLHHARKCDRQLTSGSDQASLRNHACKGRRKAGWDYAGP